MFNTLLRNVILTRVIAVSTPGPNTHLPKLPPFSVTYVSYTHAYLHIHTCVCVCRDHTKSLSFLEKAQVMYTAVKESGVSPQGVRAVYTSTEEASVSMPAGRDSFHVCWHLLNVKINIMKGISTDTVGGRCWRRRVGWFGEHVHTYVVFLGAVLRQPWQRSQVRRALHTNATEANGVEEVKRV